MYIYHFSLEISVFLFNLKSAIFFLSYNLSTNWIMQPKLLFCFWAVGQRDEKIKFDSQTVLDPQSSISYIVHICVFMYHICTHTYMNECVPVGMKSTIMTFYKRSCFLI